MSELLMHGIPWWGYLVFSLSSLTAYICRQFLRYLLWNKALDKVDASQVPELISAITGHRLTNEASSSIQDARSHHDHGIGALGGRVTKQKTPAPLTRPTA